MNRPIPPDTTSTVAVYDYRQFGRHRLRTPNGAIVDLPVPLAPTAQVWVATMWPDPHVYGGWARQLWTLEAATRPGWVLPFELASGDVVEFGADTPAGPVRWYGILKSYEVDRWTTVQGPYPMPGDAWDAAQRQLAAVRFEPPDPTTGPTAATATPLDPQRPHVDRRRHHRPIRPRRGSNPT